MGSPLTKVKETNFALGYFLSAVTNLSKIFHLSQLSVDIINKLE